MLNAVVQESFSVSMAVWVRSRYVTGEGSMPAGKRQKCVKTVTSKQPSQNLSRFHAEFVSNLWPKWSQSKPKQANASPRVVSCHAEGLAFIWFVFEISSFTPCAVGGQGGMDVCGAENQKLHRLPLFHLPAIPPHSISFPFLREQAMFLHVSLAFLVSPPSSLPLCRSQDMQMTRGLARQSDSTRPRSASER